MQEVNSLHGDEDYGGLGFQYAVAWLHCFCACDQDHVLELNCLTSQWQERKEKEGLGHHAPCKGTLPITWLPSKGAHLPKDSPLPIVP